MSAFYKNCKKNVASPKNEPESTQNGKKKLKMSKIYTQKRKKPQ